jgi:hypothetical protein
MEGLGAAVGTQDICRGTGTLMSRTGLTGRGFVFASVPEVRTAKEKTAAMNSWFCDLSPDATEEGWFLEQRGFAAWEFRALNILDSP